MARIVAAVRAARPGLAGQLERMARFDDGRLTITVPAGDPLAKVLERPANRELLSQAVRDCAGPDADWRVVTAKAASPAPATATAESPAVQAVLDVLGGTVEERKPRGGDERPS
ncbi:MAG: hypothetical protein D6696_17040 [Acidobacteria bacterium]|nr:MAG: hypothetical protein D6696_17040 [Acidobacteriota bacterium]